MPAQDELVSHNSPTWKPHLHNGVAGGGCWSPGMVDVPFRATGGVHNWFWGPGQDGNVYTCEQLETIYDQSVGRNCNLVIGEVITPDGLVPESDIERLAEFGRAIRRRFAEPAGETQGRGTSLELTLPQPRKIDQIVLAEDIAQGERVREYCVEGLVGGDVWKPLASGQSIGHKWIHRFEPTEVARLRLTVTKAAATPILRAFAAY
jgi:alpha-L-fucosidase